MRALVTGATGFIGGHVVEALLSAGHEVTALVRPTSDRSLLEKAGITLAVGDVTDLGSIVRACEGIDTVFHTAAIVSSYGPWEEYRRVGVLGTENVIEAAVQRSVPRFVHFGSIAVYGFRHEPGVRFTEELPFDEAPEDWNHYVREKVLSEKIVWRAHAAGKIRVTSLRPSVVIGARDRNVVTRMMTLLRMPIVGTVGLGTNRVACVVVQDLARLSVVAATSDVAVGRAYNVSGSREITQRELMRLYAAALGRRLQPFFVPYRLALASAGFMESVWQLAGSRDEPPFVRIGVPIFGKDFSVDTGRAEQELGFRASSDYEAAVTESVRWFLEHEQKEAAEVGNQA